MNRVIFTLIAMTGSVFASGVSDNLAYQDKAPTVKPNIGHFLIKLGAYNTEINGSTVLPLIGFGYQSKLTDSPIFQSVAVEFSMGYSQQEKDELIEVKALANIKLMGIHYLNPKGRNRFFVGLGSSNSSYVVGKASANKIDSITANEVVNQFPLSLCICGLFSAGIEMGAPSGIINVLQFEYDQPLFEPVSLNNPSERRGKASISYSFGF